MKSPQAMKESVVNNPLPGLPLVESPLFPALLPELGLSAEETRIGLELHYRGFAVFDFPDPDLESRMERIQANLSPRYGVNFVDPASDKTIGEQRIQDAWTFDPDIRSVAANAGVIDLLTKLYGRPAFPFQTLNFPVGTQQSAHSDMVHFSSQPEKFMCGVWLAMEDITSDAGPLFYYPGSHRWPVMSNALIGRRGSGQALNSAQDPFAEAWQALCAINDARPEVFLARKGQALIWSANLLHGGSPQTNPCLTRWSQVTHYYFDDCLYYTPAFSDEALGSLDLRQITAISDGQRRPNTYQGEPVDQARHQASVTQSGRSPSASSPLRWLRRMLALER